MKPLNGGSAPSTVNTAYTGSSRSRVLQRRGGILAKKLEWLRSVKNTFGECGEIIYVDGKPIGYAQYAPPEMLPLSAEYPSGPPSEDAVLISCLFIVHEE